MGEPIAARLPAHPFRSRLLLGRGDRDGEGWTYDARILWTASLVHDLGLTRVPRNTMCFEVEGAEIARRFPRRQCLPADDAEQVAIAIILHMQASVTLGDGVEAVLLDRSTSLAVRGEGFALVDDIRADVMRDFPRRAFDRLFLAQSNVRSPSGGIARARVCSVEPDWRIGWRARRGPAKPGPSGV